MNQPRTTWLLRTAALLCLVYPAAARAQDAPTTAELSLAMSAKVICSAVFVSGRAAEEAWEHSIFSLPGTDEIREASMEVDSAGKAVHMTLGELTRTAKYYGDQGCVIHPRGKDGVFFEPVNLHSKLPDPMSQPWPMGDLLPDEPFPPEVNKEGLKDAVDAAFADPAGLTAAFLVVYKGRIIAERYGQGAGKDTQLESWSMGKSLTATLLGVLAQEEEVKLFDPAPVPEWQPPDDPRSKIRVADLLRMSSGLRFTSMDDPRSDWEHGHPDHFYIYSGAINAFEYSVSRPPEFPPNTVGRYRNCDPLTIGYIIQRIVTGRGEDYLSFPQRALFDRIGIRKQVLEPDPYGNFLLTGYDYGTARNWARLGLLYLQDGMWQGKRILPENWSEFVSTPAPAWETPVYGGLFWLNRSGMMRLPADAYFMAGHGGQRVLIVPTRQLVIVRLGHSMGDRPGMRTLNSALALLMEAVPETQRQPPGRQ